jgi:TetR/AcrR family transcriptional regulator, copper-responsive repressor
MSHGKSGRTAKSSGKSQRRGRPATYDADIALEAALRTFWRHGYAATSLDDLSRATQMSRPSLYLAFGNKKEIYKRSLLLYRDWVRSTIARTLTDRKPIAVQLSRFFEASARLYASPDQGSCGCFATCIANVDALDNQDIAELIADTQGDVDLALCERFFVAKAKGELPEGADAHALALMSSAILHSLAFRLRTGRFNDQVEALVDAGVRILLQSGCAKGASREVQASQAQGASE